MSKAWFGIDSIHGRYRFGSTAAPVEGVIEPKQTISIIERAWRPFKSERLYIDHKCRDFLIRNCFAGQHNDGAVNLNPIIADPFVVNFDQLASLRVNMFEAKQPIQIIIDAKASELFGAPFQLVLPAGMDLTFEVENNGTAPQRFLAALLGNIFD